MADFYATPASKLNMTAKELVTHRVAKVAEIEMNGGKIKETHMLHAFARSVAQ